MTDFNQRIIDEFRANGGHVATIQKVAVEAGEGTIAATAVDLPRAERDAAWQRFLDASPGFGEYERRTSRTIAVFHLVRDAA